MKLIILSQPRTGSTLLCSLLNSHPEVRVLVEPINPDTHNHHMKPIIGAPYLMPESEIQNNISGVLDVLFDSNIVDKWMHYNKIGSVMSGFKIMAHQIRGLSNEKRFWEYLKLNNVSVLTCFRRNILMQYVSDLITIATGQATCWDGDVKTAMVNVDLVHMSLTLNKIIEEKTYLNNMLKRYVLKPHRINYEDFANNIGSVEDLFFNLTGQRYNLTTKLSKQNPDSLRKRVSNYSELELEIRRLRLDHLLEN